MTFFEYLRDNLEPRAISTIAHSKSTPSDAAILYLFFRYLLGQKKKAPEGALELLF
jgi:hypothetical protein